MIKVQLYELLKKYWGYDQFRSLQEEIILSVMDGHDTLALLPTGGGKSLCFQVPGLLLEGVCLVVSPLIALMKDQVDQLNQRQIRAAAIYSGMNSYEIEAILSQAVFGDLKFLYVSPERLKTDVFLGHFKQMKVGLIAVDEAHCISQWGYDFRPPYLEIAEIRPFTPHTPLLALTATATLPVIEDIQKKLFFQNGQCFRKSFYRENLIYMVFKEEDKRGRLLRLIHTLKGTGIVYVRNRRKTEEIAAFLNHNGIKSGAYHAGLSAKEREAKQNGWMNERIQVMVSTNAFGMGIDKPNVRFVVHLDIPDSPEAYFQEAGRGGRDGKLSYAVLLYDYADLEELELNYHQSFPELQFIRNVYQAVCNYYQIPVGNGENQKYEFNILEVCHTYNLPLVPTYNALKFVEKEGMVLLSEREETTSKVFIPLNKEELYTFQVENKTFDPFIKMLLRSYGGLFSQFAPINEELLAKRSQTTVAAIEKALTYLHSKQVIVYEKRTKKPQLVFTSGRIASDSLFIDNQYYKNLKEAAFERKQAMLDYIEDNTRCKSAALLAYFGEKAEHSCGRCNVCIEEKKRKKAKEREKELSEKIIASVNENPISIKELLTVIGEINEAEVLQLVEQMVRNQLLHLDELMNISK